MNLNFALTLCVALSLVQMATAVVSSPRPMCSIKGDPHISPFPGNFHASLAYPCLYLAAAVTMDPDSPDAVHVQVFVSSELAPNARYFVDHVTVVVNDGGYTASSDAALVEAVVNGDRDSAWNVSGTLPAHVMMSMVFDVENAVAELLLGNMTGEGFNVQISFFPRIHTAPFHRHRGLQVTSLSDGDQWASFPEALCSGAEDTSDTAPWTGPWDDDTQLLLAALGQGTPQNGHLVCQAVVDTFGSCGPSQQSAVAYCQHYMHDREKVSCLRDSVMGGSEEVLNAFLQCMQYMCGLAVVDQCEHCVMGPLCDDSTCKTLDALDCGVDNDHCLPGTICDWGLCKYVAGVGDRCLGCHMLCGTNMVCDHHEDLNECRISLGYPGCSEDGDCVTSTVCDPSDDTCRFPHGGTGCDLNEHCISPYVCDTSDSTCKADCSVGESCSDSNTHVCHQGLVCEGGICKIPVGGTECYVDEDCVFFGICDTISNTCINPCVDANFAPACGRCLHLTLDVKEYGAALAYCGLYGSLVVMTKDLEDLNCVADFIYTLLNFQNTDFQGGPFIWLGTQWVGNTHQWLDNTILSANNPIWDSNGGEPHYVSDQQCVLSYVPSRICGDVPCGVVTAEFAPALVCEVPAGQP